MRKSKFEKINFWKKWPTIPFVIVAAFVVTGRSDGQTAFPWAHSRWRGHHHGVVILPDIRTRHIAVPCRSLAIFRDKSIRGQCKIVSGVIGPARNGRRRRQRRRVVDFHLMHCLAMQRRFNMRGFLMRIKRTKKSRPHSFVGTKDSTKHEKKKHKPTWQNLLEEEEKTYFFRSISTWCCSSSSANSFRFGWLWTCSCVSWCRSIADGWWTALPVGDVSKRPLATLFAVERGTSAGMSLLLHKKNSKKKKVKKTRLVNVLPSKYWEKMIKKDHQSINQSINHQSINESIDRSIK